MLFWLKNKMAGRNGVDRLSIALLAIAIALNFVVRFTRLPIIAVFAVVLAIIAIWRILSKNLAKRREENHRFTNISGDIKDAIQNRRFKRQQSKQFKFFTCPDCKCKLRVPLGHGKINITCPRCGIKFSGKS